MLEWLRNRPRRDLILALSLAGGFALLVATVVPAMVRTVDRTVHHEFHSSGDHAFSGSQEVAYDRGFDVSSGGRLVVELGDFDVAVATGSGSEARVRVHMNADASEALEILEQLGFAVEARGGNLHIKTAPDRHRGDWKHRDNLGLGVEVTVPSRFDVHVQTGDGDVALESVEGTVELQTGDGDISLEGVTGPQVRIQTGDGDVYAGDLEAESLRVQTGDGDIFIEELTGALRASTGDGDVQVEIARFEGVQIQTGDGDVSLHLSPGVRADVDIVGEAFRIADAFALPVRIQSRHIEGVLNGGGPRLSVRVGDGTISLIER